MFKIINFLLFVIVAFLPFKSLEAVEVKGLYQASIAIESQNSQDRARALKKALAAVMLKVGGQKSVLNNQVIKQSLKNYGAYLSQYRYHVKPLQLAEKSSKDKQLFLLASFNEEKINQLFQQANLPLWGSLRPQILLWLIDEQGLTRTIMSNASESNLPVKVNEFSTQRGLPILMPLMDLTDANSVAISDIWGRFQQPIIAASKRYFAEAIIVMRISNSSLVTMASESELGATNVLVPTDCGLLCEQAQAIEQPYVLDWSLIDVSTAQGQQQFSQQYQGDNPQVLLQQGLDDITELIYQRYALSATNQNNLVIEVANVDSLATYVEVFDFLTNLSSVNAVTLLSAKGEVRRFNLDLLGSVDAWLASLRLNKQLQQYIDPLAKFDEPLAPANGESSVPVFYWGN